MSRPGLDRQAWFSRLPTSLWVGVGVFAFAMLFALYTHHAWEDWYITFRPAKNLATGHGLVFNEGERVHTFTSVIGTLLPALLSFLTFNVSDTLTLWMFRIVCALALGASAALLTRASRAWFTGLAPTVLLLTAAALDAKTVDFTINGMETAFTLLGLSLFLYFQTSDPDAKLGMRLGGVWALLQYTRPDGFIYALLLMASMLLFRGDRKETLRTLAVSAGWATILFAPWFLFATGYYGSAVPHSLVAKQAWLDRSDAGFYLERALGVFRSLFLLRPGTLDFVFTPPYASQFSYYPAALGVSRVLAAAASFVWLFPRIGFAGRAASLTFLGYWFYLSVFTPLIYPWYMPGAAWLAVVALAFGFDALRRFLAARETPSIALKIGSAAAVALVAWFALAQTLVTAHQFRFAQRVIEDGQRRQIGEWLKANAASTRETVFLECAGYIGFYSGLKLYDYPGMTAPETVAARHLLRTEDFLALVKQLRPDWLVLRPSEQELAGMWRQDSLFLMRNYRVMKIFDAGGAIDSLSFKPYEPYFRHDARFVVARRLR